MHTTLTKPDVQGALQYFTNKMKYTTGPVETSHKIKENAEDIQIVDVRAEKDFREGHVPGAINLPQEEWDSFRGLSKDKTNILYCYSHVCHLAAKAAMHFAAKGYPVMEMDGGFKSWNENKLETEKS
jgi:rhodanese-related sulfurtransferase